MNEETNRIYLYRLDKGEKYLYTFTDLPIKKYSEDPEGINEFARLLGENILLDFALTRRLFE